MLNELIQAAVYGIGTVILLYCFFGIVCWLVYGAVYAAYLPITLVRECYTEIKQYKKPTSIKGWLTQIWDAFCVVLASAFIALIIYALFI